MWGPDSAPLPCRAQSTSAFHQPQGLPFFKQGERAVGETKQGAAGGKGVGGIKFSSGLIQLLAPAPQENIPPRVSRSESVFMCMHVWAAKSDFVSVLG